MFIQKMWKKSFFLIYFFLFSSVRDGVDAAGGGEGEESPEEAGGVCGHSASVQPHRATGVNTDGGTRSPEDP